MIDRKRNYLKMRERENIVKKYIGLEDMSHVNCSNVLQVIRNHGEVSRKQIVDITGLSWGGMTKIVNRLFENEYIVEEKSKNLAGSGRIPNVIRMNQEKHFVLGVDINKTGLRAYVTDLSGDLKQEYFVSNVFENKKQLLGNIINFLELVFNDFKKNGIHAIGIAMQGSVDVEQGISIRFPECKDWKNVPLAEILKENFQTNVYLEHDPDCMLYSNLSMEDSKNLVLFRVDHSIGMAVSVNGTILRGNGILEVAHHIAVPGGKACKCGRKGCLEAYIAPCIKGKGVDRASVKDMIYPLAVTLYNMVGIFCADTIILTGELMKYHNEFEEELLFLLQKLMQEKTIKVKFEDDTRSAVKGAAFIAMQRAIDTIKL